MVIVASAISPLKRGRHRSYEQLCLSQTPTNGSVACTPRRLADEGFGQGARDTQSQTAHSGERVDIESRACMAGHMAPTIEEHKALNDTMS